MITTADVVQVALMAAALALVYCLPMILAVRYQHPRRKAIAVLNILLGWTFLGWLLLMVWVLPVRRYHGQGRRWRVSRVLQKHKPVD